MGPLAACSASHVKDVCCSRGTPDAVEIGLALHPAALPVPSFVGGRERDEWQVWCSRRRVASLSPVFVGGDWGRGWVAGCFVALALLFAVVTKGDACFFWPLRRVQRWSSLAELLLPASSLTRSKYSKYWHPLHNKWQMCDDSAARVWIKRHATELSATGGAFAPPPVGPSDVAVSWVRVVCAMCANTTRRCTKK